MRAINLTKIDSDNARGGYADHEEADENRNVQTSPCVVNLDAIRCFYPRKDNRPGTRITFIDGGGFAVTELFDQVQEAVRSAMQ